jgi:hypothetical protein
VRHVLAYEATLALVQIWEGPDTTSRSKATGIVYSSSAWGSMRYPLATGTGGEPCEEEYERMQRALSKGKRVDPFETVGSQSLRVSRGGEKIKEEVLDVDMTDMTVKASKFPMYYHSSYGEVIVID